jgi:hypothetical protein
MFPGSGAGRILYAVGNAEGSESHGIPTARSAAKADNDKRINNANDATE